MKTKIIITITAFLLSIGNTPIVQAQITEETAQEIIQVYDQENAREIPSNLKLTLDFKQAPLSAVMDYLSETTGMVIISTYSMDSRISVISKQPVSFDQALELINSAMKENGYAVIQTGNILKIVRLTEAKLMSVPVRKGNDPDKISDSDEIITQIIPILYADAASLRDDLMGLMSEYAEFSSNQSSNSLIITDTSTNIKRIAKIVKSLDTQLTTIAEIRVFRLVYADAENVANLINELFEDANSGGSSQNPMARMFEGRGGGGGRGGMMGGGNPFGGGSSSGGRTAASKVTAAEDELTNSVVVSGPGEAMDVIENMIKEIDTNPDEERGLYVYPLENASATNVKDLLNNLFSELASINQDNTAGFGNVGRRGGNAAGGGGSSSTSGSDLSDETYIEADEDTNSLLILTSNKNYDKIKAVIQDLDKPVPQVFIKVLIAELTVDDSMDLGLEFTHSRTRASGDSYTSSTGFLPETTAGFSFESVTGDLTARLHALQQSGKLNILSRPYILTRNNQPATITVGQEVPYITDSTYTETGQTRNTVSYEDIGIILNVTPYINPQGLVIMDVAPEISSIDEKNIQISEGVNATVFLKRTASSKVAVQDGQTIVIGGLMQDRESSKKQKVPILGDIPLLGMLFQYNTTTTEKTELLIFLTPQVSDTNASLRLISDYEKDKSNLLKSSPDDSLLNEHIDNMINTAEK